VSIRRLAIRAAKFGSEADFLSRAGVKDPRQKGLFRLEKGRAFEGPIRIPSRSLLFLFNALAFPSISSKSLKFRSVLFSIPTPSAILANSSV